jgi:5'-nucleotidase/UDP-sugar diphosphatase
MKPSSIRATLTFLCINDWYRLDPTATGWGGVGELSTLIKEQRLLASSSSQNASSRGGGRGGEEAVQLLAAGDVLAAGKNAALLGGLQMVDTLNYLNVSVAVLGNHEFDQGDAIYECIRRSSFPWLGANVLVRKHAHEDTVEEEPIAHRYVVSNLFGGRLRLGMFGVCTTATPQLAYPPANVRFSDPIAAARGAVDELVRVHRCNVVVGLTHLGVEEDAALARAVPGIDLIVGGHDHTPIVRREGLTTIIKCGVDAEYLGRVQMHFTDFPESVETRPRPFFLSWEMLPNRVEWLAPDPGVLEVVEAHDRSFAKTDAEVLAHLGGPLSSAGSRIHECSFAYLVADAAAAAAGADLALINGGFVRGNRDYTEGEKFTVGMLRQELPFLRRLRRLSLTGAQVREVLEQALREVEHGLGHFPHLSAGWELRFDAARPPLHRIVSLRFRGEELAPDRALTLATTEYLARGGDGFTVLSGVPQGGFHGDHRFVFAVVADFLRARPLEVPLEVPLEQRVLAVISQ